MDIFNELIEKLNSNGIYITLETTPTSSANLKYLIKRLEKSEAYKFVDGFTTTDNPLAKLKYGSLFGAIKLQEKFRKPVIATLSMRDRNKLALQSDLLGANDFNVRAILALTGDSAKISDQPNTKGVFEGDSLLLLDIIDSLNNGINYAGQEFKPLDKPNKIYPFAVINSFAKNPKTLIKKMIKKIDHGAVGIISQPVYSIEQAKTLLKLFEIAKQESNSKLPKTQLIIGYFPITKFKTAKFLASHVPGISVPQIWLNNLREASIKDTRLELEKGFSMSQKLFNDLIEFHPKIHIMTANNFELATKILSN